MKDLINLENIGNPEVLEKITNWSEIKDHVKIEYEIGEDGITFNKRKIETVIPKEFFKRDKRYMEEYIINAIIYYKEHNKNINIQLNK